MITINGVDYVSYWFSESTVICVDLSACIDVIYSATDSWSSENSWDVVDASGAVLASGGNVSGQIGTHVVLMDVLILLHLTLIL